MKYKSPWERPDLISEAQKRLKKFVITIYKLLVEKKQKYDLVIGAGNSGINMAKVTEMIYGHLKLKAPPMLKVPTYLRTKSGKRIKFDNSVLIPHLKKEIKNVKKIENILFVDDDISKGATTLREVLRLISKLNITQTTVTIVAEDYGFSNHAKIKNYKIKFYPFSKKSKEWKGISNFISYGIPYNIFKPIRDLYSDKQIDSKERFSILLGEPVRGLKDKKPILTHKWDNILKRKIKNFDVLKKKFKNHIKKKIAEAIGE
jgi:orotate phosphoribosyltransferase-like protein